MNALLVSPKYPDTYWSFRHALRFERKRAAFPPLGLLTVSSLLPTEWRRRVVDLNVRDIADADYAWADIVLISAMLVQKVSTNDVVAECRVRGKRILLGGPITNSWIPSGSSIEHVFIGEAEETLPKFLRDLANGEAAPFYSSDTRPPIALAPVPDFSLVNATEYGAMAVQFSRGCPFQCEFCDIIETFGRVPRCKSPEHMIAEIDALYATGYRGTLFIVDDNFIGNRLAVKRLLPRLEDWQNAHGRPYDLMTEASINLADDEGLMAAMSRAGFRRVFVGIETPVEASLMETNKGQNLRGDLAERVATIQRNGMEVMGGFIVGFDSDPEDVFALQHRFISESAIPVAMVGVLTVLPSTQLWRRLHGEGRILTESIGDNTSGILNYVPKMDATTLVNGYRALMSSLYHPNTYYRRALASLRRQPKSIPSPKPPLIAGLRSISRIMLRLGVLAHGRRAFWRYFLSVLAHNRELMADAMRLAAMGYHVRRLTASQWKEG